MEGDAKRAHLDEAAARLELPLSRFGRLQTLLEFLQLVRLFEQDRLTVTHAIFSALQLSACVRCCRLRYARALGT